MSGRRETPRIDREKVRAHARKLDGTGRLVWLDRAIDMLPDEAGSWQVGVDWEEVLPAWFRSLSPGADPCEWAEAVVDLRRRPEGDPPPAVVADPP